MILQVHWIQRLGVGSISSRDRWPGVSLGGDKRYSTIARIRMEWYLQSGSARAYPWPFRYVAMTVGNNDRGVRNVILGARSDAVGVRGIMSNDWNGCICGYCNRLLGAGLATGIIRAKGRTLKA